MNGKVTTWQMTEEQRLAYIAKHPIVKTKKPKGESFTNIHTLEKSPEKKKPRVIDNVDKVKLREMYIAGEKLDDIAKKLDITVASLNNYIREQRRVDLEKWPYRNK
jgi:NADH:ubiquinone oxidoreductase subunit E